MSLSPSLYSFRGNLNKYCYFCRHLLLLASMFLTCAAALCSEKDEEEAHEDRGTEMGTSAPSQTPLWAINADVQPEYLQAPATRLGRESTETGAELTAATTNKPKQPGSSGIISVFETHSSAASSEREQSTKAPPAPPAAELEATAGSVGSPKSSADSEPTPSRSSVESITGPPIDERVRFFSMVGSLGILVASVCVFKLLKHQVCTWFRERWSTIISRLGGTTSTVTAWLQWGRSSITRRLHRSNPAAIIRWLEVASWGMRAAFLAYCATLSPAEAVCCVVMWLASNIAGVLALKYRHHLLTRLDT